MTDFKKLDHRQAIQLIWGGALLLMGLAFFFRISEILDRIAGIEQFTPANLFLRIAFYCMGILLIGGGIKKIYGVLHPKDPSNE